ncbi:exonuclease [Arthrobacter phage Shambre1]|uniref:Exonuclease n=1 Tax=Arthrobacter phage Shambre1 TaxID=2927284 RepID=A0A977KNL5_9CAUD|nr:exonuclease [Arthrobacter phage Shambre1]UXE04776.1 exonuclease [Arthrobacter phage Shambre1]
MLGTLRKPPGVTLDQQQLAEQIALEYEDVMVKGIAGHARSAQKLIGPSEIGVPCDRALICKLAQLEEPSRGPAWKPAAGTAMHDQQERWFSAPAPTALTTADDWEVEQKVAVGQIGPDTIKGSTDLWRKIGAVIDHKFVGQSRLKKYKGKGPGEQYRTQAHTYGKGWEDEGWEVKLVMICFVPRDGELSDNYYWWEPYDREVAEAALRRANNRYTLLRTLGLNGALSLFPLCDASINPDWEWCPWCNPLRTITYNPRPFAARN